jgi:hypothetical protein
MAAQHGLGPRVSAPTQSESVPELLKVVQTKGPDRAPF